jgi:hypothetical protein
MLSHPVNLNDSFLSECLNYVYKFQWSIEEEAVNPTVVHGLTITSMCITVLFAVEVNCKILFYFNLIFISR